MGVYYISVIVDLSMWKKKEKKKEKKEKKKKKEEKKKFIYIFHFIIFLRARVCTDILLH